RRTEFPRWSCRLLERLGGLDLAGAEEGVAARDVLADLGDARVVVELPGRVLEAQVEELFLQLPHAGRELLVVQLGVVGALHQISSWRTTNCVLIGSLCIARRMASRATGSATPESSNITRPGFTTATQCSGLPLPEPMRVSAGFCVTGLSGKTLIQTFPPRLM